MGKTVLRKSGRSVGRKSGRSVGRRSAARPTEHSEQVVVVGQLRQAGVLVCAIPIAGRRGKVAGAKLVREGMSKGAPDLLIFDAPPALDGKVGTALEMKREGATKSTVRPEQRRWLEKLSERGWHTLVGYGAKDALKKLKDAGYDVRPFPEQSG